MTVNLDIFGASFDCDCGRKHKIDPREIVYGDDAIAKLPQVLERVTDGRRVGLLADKRTDAVAGEQIATVLRSNAFDVYEVITPDTTPDGPFCDDQTLDRIAAQLGLQDVFVSIGSGVITDLVKWHAANVGRPFVAFATAASMNGYASPNIAATLKGVKSLINGRCAKAILSEPSVLANAPYAMTASGLGDVLAKSVSATDWRMNQIVFGDFYCPRAVGLIAEIEPLYLQNPEAILARDAQALEALFQALLLTGAGMTMAGSSTPASGGEHLIGHALDMMSAIDGVKHDMHGRQVGLGTIVASELYRRLLQIESPAFGQPSAVDTAFWGPMANEVQRAFEGKQERIEQAKQTLAMGNAWDRMREALAPMTRPPEVTRDCLKRADAAYRLEDIDCSFDRFVSAFTHARQMRARFTIFDLAEMAGIMPRAAGEIVEQWLVE